MQNALFRALKLQLGERRETLKLLRMFRFSVDNRSTIPLLIRTTEDGEVYNRSFSEKGHLYASLAL